MTEELKSRPSREPDLAVENATLRELASHLTEDPRTVLQKLVERTMRLCRAGSAGISLEEVEDGKEIFRWRAVAGEMSCFLGGTMPRVFSPCGVTVERKQAQLMKHLVRHYPYAEGLGVPLTEVLLVPFFRQGRAIGTMWVVSHHVTPAFDAEDARLIEGLCQFTSVAVEALYTLESVKRTQFQLSEVQTKLEAALDAGAIATWSWDIARDRVFADAACAEIFGVSAEDAAGGPLAVYASAMHPDDRERVRRDIVAAVEQDRRYESEYRLTAAGGTERWVMARGTLMRDEQRQPVQLAGVLVDITARKTEQLLREQQQHERWSAEREMNEALREARDQALAASNAKDDFLAALSHELRTPLNPVLLLASDGAGNPAYPPEVREDFESVRKNIELEARLIDDLLDVTRITRGKLKLDLAAADLHAILHDAENKVHADAMGKEIRIHWALEAGHARVWADPVRLQQLFWNVLKNAVKFTPRGGSIRIESSNTDDGGRICVRVQDSGIGIPPSDLPGIFEAFAQGANLEREGTHLFGGLGLGLAISQRIMQMHEGEIQASSAGANQGACFTIEIPVLLQEAPGTPGDAGPPAPAAGEARDAQACGVDEDKTPAGRLRILIVEDHEPSRDVLERLLTRRQYDVTTATTGQQACACAASQEFDLMICDLGLPDTDGHELLRQIHRLRPGLPAIALTGYGAESDVRRSNVAGYFRHLTKPLNLAQLEEVLAEIRAGHPRG